MNLPRNWNRTNTVAVHAGSGRQLRRLVKFCWANGIVLVQACGGMEKYLPKNPKAPIVDAPNLSPTMVGVIHVLPKIVELLKHHGIEAYAVKETHQKTKKTVPATAKQMASVVGIKEKDIQSVRDDNEALGMGVDMKDLPGHGHHVIKFRGTDGVGVEVVTRVNGRGPYGNGAIILAKLCVGLVRSQMLETRYHTIMGVKKADEARRHHGFLD